MKDTYGKLTSIVVYNTNYFHKHSTKRVHIEFSPEKEVVVNALIIIPTLKHQKASIIFEGNFLT